MSTRMYWALIASLCAVALMCAADETSAAAPRGVANSARSHSHSRFHPPFARSFRRNNQFNNGFFAYWPDDYPSDSYNQPPVVSTEQPISNGVGNANAYDIPWDWAHRYPPLVAPSDKPYVTSCPTEIVKVPGHFGQEQSINITRCY